LRWAYKQYDTKSTVKKEETGYNYAVPKKDSDVGFLLIITGASGAGKDSLMLELLKHPLVKKLNLKKIVTCTDRLPRPGETHGIDYHFVTHETLMEMDKKGELVEEITLTGSSSKATPKSEIERLLKGEDLVWRIDPSRAAEVATGNFFKKHFTRYSKILQKQTVILCITAPKEDIVKRRKVRDGKNYSFKEYFARDEQELPHLTILREKAVIIDNLEGHLEETVNLAVNLTRSNYEKIKNRRI
jgi:guanylate kinase